MTIRFGTIAWLCTLVPVVIVIICTSWSMQAGLTPVCFPLVEGCLSISAACRPEPVIYLFRSVMLPMSFLLMRFWWLNNTVLTQHCTKQDGLTRSVFLLSMTGAVFLPLYVIFLGTEGQIYEFLRRLGIYFFFGATGMAQLLTTLRARTLLHLDKQEPVSRRHVTLAWKAQLVIVISMLLIGPVNLLLKEVLVDSRQIENIIEWNFALAMFSWYALQSVVCQGIDTSLSDRVQHQR